MDPRDHLRALLDGMACTVCHEPVPAERIRLLARREDLTFVQIQCDRCGSTALGFLGNSPMSGAAAEASESDSGAEASESDSAAAPISANEVLEMHEFLTGWNGDARSLIAGDAERAAFNDDGPRPGR